MTTSACEYKQDVHVQMAWHPGCSVSWLQSPYCNQECGRCSADTACNDTPPDGSYTCAQQVNGLAEGALRGLCSPLDFTLDVMQGHNGPVCPTTFARVLPDTCVQA